MAELNVEEFRRLAEECRRFAARANNPKDREALKLQARAWDKVAEEHEHRKRMVAGWSALSA